MSYRNDPYFGSNAPRGLPPITQQQQQHPLPNQPLPQRRRPQSQQIMAPMGPMGAASHVSGHSRQPPPPSFQPPQSYSSAIMQTAPQPPPINFQQSPQPINFQQSPPPITYQQPTTYPQQQQPSLVAVAATNQGQEIGLAAVEMSDISTTSGGGSGGSSWERLVLKDASFSSDISKPNIWGQEFAGRLMALKCLHKRLRTRLHNSLSAPLQQFLLIKRRNAQSLPAFQESLRACWEKWTMKDVREFARVLSDHVPELIWLAELTLSAELGVIFCSDFFNQDLSDHYIHFEPRTQTQTNYGWKWPPLTPVVIDPYKTLQKLAAQLCRAVHHWTSSSTYCDQPWNLEQLDTIVRDTLESVLDECLPLPVPKERDLINEAQRLSIDQQKTHSEMMRLLQHRKPWLERMEKVWKSRERLNVQLMEHTDHIRKDTENRNEASRELKIQDRNWMHKVASENLQSLGQVIQLGDTLKQIQSNGQHLIDQQTQLAKLISALNATFVSYGTHMFSNINSIKPSISSIATNIGSMANSSATATATAARTVPVWPTINWATPPQTAQNTAPTPTVTTQTTPQPAPQTQQTNQPQMQQTQTSPSPQSQVQPLQSQVQPQMQQIPIQMQPMQVQPQTMPIPMPMPMQNQNQGQMPQNQNQGQMQGQMISMQQALPVSMSMPMPMPMPMNGQMQGQRSDPMIDMTGGYGYNAPAPPPQNGGGTMYNNNGYHPQYDNTSSASVQRTNISPPNMSGNGHMGGNMPPSHMSSNGHMSGNGHMGGGQRKQPPGNPIDQAKHAMQNYINRLQTAHPPAALQSK